MRFLRLLAVLLAVFGLQGAETSLQAVLAKMDLAAAKFQGLRADVKQVSHIDVVQSDEIETGKVVVRRPSFKDLRMRIDLVGVNAQTVWFNGNKAQKYYPKANLVEEYPLGKFSKVKDQLLTLAFGSNSKDLQSAYSLKLGGPEAVEGRPATRIVLVPKDPQMLAMFPEIELWISDQGLTMQQKLHEPGKDYVLATYTNIEQANVSDAEVKIDVPKNAKWTTPLK